jgi:RNA polymerase-binding transcription factor
VAGADLISWLVRAAPDRAAVAMTSKVVNETLLGSLKDVLLRKRGEILASSTGTRPLPASVDVNSRQGDLADQASGNNEVHIQLKLKQTDAKILQAIEEALYRMEKGVYGICRDCGEPIAPARLEAIPWTRVCITCKQKQNT